MNRLPVPGFKSPAHHYRIQSSNKGTLQAFYWQNKNVLPVPHVGLQVRPHVPFTLHIRYVPEEDKGDDLMVARFFPFRANCRFQAIAVDDVCDKHLSQSGYASPVLRSFPIQLVNYHQLPDARYMPCLPGMPNNPTAHIMVPLYKTNQSENVLSCMISLQCVCTGSCPMTTNIMSVGTLESRQLSLFVGIDSFFNQSGTFDSTGCFGFLPKHKPSAGLFGSELKVYQAPCATPGSRDWQFCLQDCQELQASKRVVTDQSIGSFLDIEQRYVKYSPGLLFMHFHIGRQLGNFDDHSIYYLFHEERQLHKKNFKPSHQLERKVCSFEKMEQSEMEEKEKLGHKISLASNQVQPSIRPKPMPIQPRDSNVTVLPAPLSTEHVPSGPILKCVALKVVTTEPQMTQIPCSIDQQSINTPPPLGQLIDDAVCTEILNSSPKFNDEDLQLEDFTPMDIDGKLLDPFFPEGRSLENDSEIEDLLKLIS